ncbi:hypothetical protein LPJ61_006865, partial [Coemansia biformis]
ELRHIVLSAPTTNTIVAGDFNAYPNPALDRPHGGDNGIRWAPFASCLGDLEDITRRYRPDDRLYAFFRGEQRSRIDHTRVAPDMVEDCHGPRTDILDHSDHHPLSISIKS